MATQFYVEQADRGYLSAIANEAITAGTLVHDDGAGLDQLLFADEDEDFGLAVYDAETLAAEDHDINTTVADFAYDTGDRAKYQPAEEAAIVKIRTITDNADDPAPSIGHRDIVGIVDETDGTLESGAANYAGRIVEEGYTSNDTTPVTFNRTNNNFKAVGRAHRPAKQNGNTVTAYDEPVRVVLFGELIS